MEMDLTIEHMYNKLVFSKSEIGGPKLVDLNAVTPEIVANLKG